MLLLSISRRQGRRVPGDFDEDSDRDFDGDSDGEFLMLQHLMDCLPSFLTSFLQYLAGLIPVLYVLL